MSNSAKAQQTRSLFRMETSISVAIKATPQKIWGLLTDAAHFPTWNSTIRSIDGKIAQGETIKLKTSYTDRLFTLKISSFESPQRMVWQDGAAPMFKGVRSFVLQTSGDGMTTFTMTEVLSGVMLPMIAPSLPDFVAPFERYAADLKQAAE